MKCGDLGFGEMGFGETGFGVNRCFELAPKRMQVVCFTNCCW